MGPVEEAVQRRERGLGGPEMEQPGVWEDKATPASQLMEIEANFKDGHWATSGPAKDFVDSYTLLVLLPHCTLRHLPPPNFPSFDSRQRSANPTFLCKTSFLRTLALPSAFSLLLTIVTYLLVFTKSPYIMYCNHNKPSV